MTGDFQYNTNLPLQHYQVGNELITAENVINQTQGNISQTGMGSNMIPGVNTVVQTQTFPTNIPGEINMPTNMTGQIQSTNVPSYYTGNIIPTQTYMYPQTSEFDKNLLYPSQDLLNITNSDEDELEESEVRKDLQGLNLNQPITTGVSNILNSQPLSTGGIETYTNRTLTNPTTINTENLNVESWEQPLEENVSPKFQGQVSPKYKQGFSFQESNVGQGANIQQMPSTNSELKRTEQIMNQNLNQQSKL
jgi:hypothetical protein